MAHSSNIPRIVTDSVDEPHRGDQDLIGSIVPHTRTNGIISGNPQDDVLHAVDLQSANEKATAHNRLPSTGTYLTVGADHLSPSSTRYTGKEDGFDEKTGYVNPLLINQPGPKVHKRSAMSKLKGLFRKKKEDELDEDDDDSEEDLTPEENAAQARASAHIDPTNDTTDPTPFFQKPLVLASLVDPKNLEELEAMGGSEGLLHGLGVDGTRGLNVDGSPSAGASGPGMLDAQYKASAEDRKRVYGVNILPTKKTKSLLQLMWMAMKDKVLIILGIAAVISLVLGIYQSVGVEHEPLKFGEKGCDQQDGCKEPQIEWVEGVAILIAVLIVVLVGSVNDWQKERQFKKLNEKKDDRMINCIRGGVRMSINTKDILVGDICVVETGEILPVDGIFLRGHNVKCDESGATGESDLIKKASYEECIEERNSLPPGKTLKKDCFLISGAKVTEGVGEYVVIAVGTKSFNGRLMMALRTDAESTPLQMKLNRLAELIAKFGATAGATLFFALFIRFCIQLRDNPDRTPDEKGQAFISILIIAVTLVVVAVPEGLPLAVTLALAFATKRMTQENLLVRVLASCETAGGANVVCTDKTGTLTLNEMQIVAMSLGVTAKGVRRLEENPGRTNANKVEDENGVAEAPNSRTGRPDFTFDLSELNQIATPEMQKLLNESFCINSTAFEDIDKETGKVSIVGSKTEAAMLLLGREVGWTGATELRAAANVHQVFPFSSEVKAMGTAITLPNGKIRLLVKGASEILLKVCTSHVDIDGPSGAAADIKVIPFNEETMTNLQRTIYFYASQCLRTIAICYKDYEPGTFPSADGDQELLLADLAKDLTMLTVVAIEDPLRPGVIESVAKCNKAGVAVKMCTGDNVLTARSIATQCGMYTPGGIVIEGPAFRRLSHQERLEIVPRLQVMARSSPEDKRLLVESLRELGNIVCVTGDGSNDAPALKASQIGFAMGISGTEVAKEASDIIVMDDSFASLTLAIKWGRCVNDSVRKFLQFQLSVNVTAVVLTFITAVASDEEESVLSAVQLLWVNLIMDTFAALALATDPATERSLDRQPEKANAPLLNIDMVKMILGQACYQIVVCFVLHWRGHDILGAEPGGGNSELKTLVFNSFVFCQIFNMINCRSLTNDLNFWHGIHKNHWFMLIFCIMVAGQVLIVFVGGAAFSVTRIGGRDWGISLVIGVLAIPWGACIRLMPSGPLYRLLVKLKIYPDPNALPEISPASDYHNFQYAEPVYQTRSNLDLFRTIRSESRLRASPLVLKSRRRRMKDAKLQYPTLLTMAPSLLLGSVAAGQNWLAPLDKEAEAARENQPASQPASGKLSFHPDSDKNDPIYRKYSSR